MGHHQSVDLFHRLIEAYPQALHHPRSVLHIVCRYNKSAEIMRAVMQAYPEAAHTVYFDGELPLHTACQNPRSASLIPALVRANVVAVRSKDSHGKLPLHHACQSSLPVSVLQHLVFLFPESINVYDRWNKIPSDYCTDDNVEARTYLANVEHTNRLIVYTDLQEKWIEGFLKVGWFEKHIIIIIIFVPSLLVPSWAIIEDTQLEVSAVIQLNEGEVEGKEKTSNTIGESLTRTES
jgi:hypothetical protein